MKRKSLLLVPTAIVLLIPALSQSLIPGDHLPPLKLSNVVNHDQKILDLSFYQDRLLILDFWSHNCTSCLQSFPALEILQKKYGDRVQVVLINKETADSTLRFFERRKQRIKKPNIPMVTADSIILSWFPHISVPHHIWVDKGKVRYITNGGYATKENIDELLAGKELDLPLKFDQSSFDRPLIAYDDKQFRDKLQYYSYIMTCISGVSMTGGYRNKNSKCRITKNCATIIELYQTAYSENKRRFQYSSTIIMEGGNPADYAYPKDVNLVRPWRERHTFYYDLVMPASGYSTIYKKMQQDICQFFGKTAVIERRKILCLLLVKKDAGTDLKTAGGTARSNILNHRDDSMVYMNNTPLRQLFNHLEYIAITRKIKTPLIDETGYSGNIDAEIPAEAVLTFNIPLLKAALNKSGLDLIESERLIDVLVIRDSE